MAKIDLHTHSTHSDGTYSPQDLMVYARQIGIHTIALTDHDIISGLKPASKKALELGLTFIPGVELEINFSNGEFHLLGLGLYLNLDVMENQLKKIRYYRHARNLRIIEKMRRAGIKATIEDINKLAGGQVISRLHIGKYLIQKGIVKDQKQAFTQYLNTGKSFYEPKQVLSLEQGFSLIKRCGGKTVIAHPYTLGLEWNDLTSFILKYKDKGLDGIEAYHPDYEFTECQRLADFALQNNLLISAGSDFHGTNRQDRFLGKSAGGMEIPEEYALPFLKKVKN